MLEKMEAIFVNKDVNVQSKNNEFHNIIFYQQWFRKKKLIVKIPYAHPMSNIELDA